MKGRNFISTQEFSPEELDRLVSRAREFKREAPTSKPLAGKSVALIFLNPSLRTRTTMELAVTALGGTPVTMNVGTDSWTLEHRDGAVMNAGKTEHVKDAARVLSRVVDAIGVRSFAGLEKLEEDLADPMISAFAKYAEVPILNLESALYHPMQGMADLMTIVERLGSAKGAKVALTWAPHPKPLPTAVANSFLLAVTRMGAEVTLASPSEYPLPEPVMQFARENGGSVRLTTRQEEALAGAQVVCAKSWGSLVCYGRPEVESIVRGKYDGWIVDESKMAAAPDTFFLHCLPVRRNVEVADAVLDGPRSAVYDEAENRLHVQTAILEALL
ncbi:MAG TPA: N-acetylornithine carbamoyltransferase [Planctomycetota bacterium]|nr:N-acetylornithine carbamoyltransferase [Planctomycetota bacterium]